MTTTGAWVLIYILMSGTPGKIHFDTEVGCMVGRDLHKIRARLEGDPVDVSVCSFNEEAEHEVRAAG